MIKELLKRLLAHKSLSQSEARSLMDSIMTGAVTDAQLAGLLIALKQKGETIEEIAGFVLSMREHSNQIELVDKNIVDGCGTGGDGSNSFNVSTAASLIAAGAGVKVAKHGNRSVSSHCGSSDILEKTGGNINPGVSRCRELLEDVGFAFLFAPAFHPAMKYAIGPRRELGVRTVFNILGPMTNPAGVKRQVIGVFERGLMEIMASVLKETGSEKVIVAHGLDGMDEFSISAPTDYIELDKGRLVKKQLSPEDVGLPIHKSNSIIGGDATYNYSILLDVINNHESPYLDASLLNAGALLYVADKAQDIREGVLMARDSVASGETKHLLERWVKESNR